MDKQIIIYCDGACSGNPGPGGWGSVTIFPENRLLEAGGGDPSTTNNRMEMTAAIAALSAVADRPEPVTLYTDSALLINGVTGWLHGWKRKGWVTAAGQPVANRDLWERLDALGSARRGRLAWRHVRGHAGHDVNERCDVIAVAFSKRQRIALYDGPAVGCGYSLLPPETSAAASSPKKKAAPASAHPRKAKGPAVYLSLVGGELRRHAAWDSCRLRVHGVAGARFKKVTSPEEEAEQLRAWGL
jgi:ribonuclease HI